MCKNCGKCKCKVSEVESPEEILVDTFLNGHIHRQELIVKIKELVNESFNLGYSQASLDRDFEDNEEWERNN